MQMRTALSARIAIAAAFFCSVLVQGQPSTDFFIEPVAGAPRNLGDNGPATSALLWSPRGVSVDAAGNLYIADTGDARIRKVTPGGIITTIAGTVPGYSGDNGPATQAELSAPSRAITAPNGDIYIADTLNQRIRRITPNGTITTIAGTGQYGFAGDNQDARGAQFSNPRDIAFDRNGTILVMDTNNQRLRRFTPGGAISTIAGSGVFGSYGETLPAIQAQFASPWGVAADASGNIYIADTSNSRIRKIATDGTITTVAGTNESGFSGDGGPGVFARLDHPTAVAVDSAGNLYIADTMNHRIRKMDTRGVITTIAGGTASGFSGDNGPATAARLNMPESIAIDNAENLYIADTGNNRIRKISPQGIITTVAGSDTAGVTNGAAINAVLFQPSGLAFDSSGNVYIADTLNHRIRRVSRDGMITTVAGTGSPGYSGNNGFATLAQLNSPDGISFDSAGNLYIADTGNNVIRKVAGGIISTVAGTGVAGNAGDFGPATSATLYNPNGVVPGPNGVLYIADSGNNRIRVVDAAGNINPYAGDPTGLPGATGDGGPARLAAFDYPRGLAIDSQNNLYVADYFNNRIRRIAADTQVITTYAGTGAGSYTGDAGQATQATLHLPAGITFDRDGNLYIADLLNNVIRAVGRNGIIVTIAGTGQPGDEGTNGPAKAALLNSPRDIAVDAEGNVYFSDQDNNRVRRLVAESTAIKTIVNAASLVAGWVAPGEAISIFGTRLGPVNGVAGSPVNGAFDTTVGGTRVLFDGVPAPVLYAGVNQVNAIVPYSVAGKSTVQMQVESEGRQASAFTLAVRSAAPGLFTLSGAGTGQAAAVNQNGTINGPANPIAAGSIISLYATGEGQTNPPGVTGQLVTNLNALPRPLQDVSVQIQGIPARILYAGSAPFAAGLMQINIVVPTNVLLGDNVPVELVVGTFAAQPGVRIAVR